MNDAMFDGLPVPQREKIKFIHTTTDFKWGQFLSSLVFFGNMVVIETNNKSIYVAPNGKILKQ